MSQGVDVHGQATVHFEVCWLPVGRLRADTQLIHAAQVGFILCRYRLLSSQRHAQGDECVAKKAYAENCEEKPHELWDQAENDSAEHDGVGDEMHLLYHRL